MIRLIFGMFLLLFSGFYCLAQSPDWSTTIAPIIYKNCSSCHHAGGIGPFELMSYADVFNNSTDIKQQVEDRLMPPWPADPAYRRFAYEALLDSVEIAAISFWIDDGMPIGDTLLAPSPPVFLPGGSLLDTIHHTIQIPPYTLTSNNDVYRWFAFHSNFTDTVYVNQIEVIPGLPHLVHHADIHYDLSGTSFYNDSVTPTPGFSGGFASNYYMNAWQPGGGIAKYPPNWGIMVPPGADFVFEIHYGPDGIGQTDTTKMNLRFITNPSNVRAVRVGWLLNNPIPAQGPLVIPANQITTFDQLSAPMSVDRSLISICPHMHMLGKSYKVWYKTITNDSVPLIDIPQWDFHWQKYYTFQKIQKIPAGARLYAVASFDNTVLNPHNPNNPPATVYSGPLTTDEMLMTYFIYATYQPGDENIILDSTLLTSNNNWMYTEDELDITIFPNPAGSKFFMNYSSKINETMQLSISNSLGELLVQKYIKEQDLLNGIDISAMDHGIYFIKISSSTRTFVKKIIKLKAD